MDTKTIGIGTVAVIALAVSILNGGKNTTTVVAASDKAVDIAAAQVAQTGTTDVKTCTREREGTADGVVLAWFCGGARMDDKTQDELNKMATENAVSITFTPRVDEKGNTVLDAKVQEGVLPSLDPVPEEAKPDDAEKPIEDGGALKIGK